MFQIFDYNVEHAFEKKYENVVFFPQDSDCPYFVSDLVLGVEYFLL